MYISSQFRQLLCTLKENNEMKCTQMFPPCPCCHAHQGHPALSPMSLAKKLPSSAAKQIRISDLKFTNRKLCASQPSLSSSMIIGTWQILRSPLFSWHVAQSWCSTAEIPRPRTTADERWQWRWRGSVLRAERVPCMVLLLPWPTGGSVVASATIDSTQKNNSLRTRMDLRNNRQCMWYMCDSAIATSRHQSASEEAEKNKKIIKSCYVRFSSTMQ